MIRSDVLPILRKSALTTASVAIILIVVIVVVVYIFVTRNPTANNGGKRKRDLELDFEGVSLSNLPFVKTVPIDARGVIPRIMRGRMLQPAADFAPGVTR
jgi:hypothetical protein